MWTAAEPKPPVEEPPTPREPPREDPPPAEPPVIVPPGRNPLEPPREDPPPSEPGNEPPRIIPPGTPFIARGDRASLESRRRSVRGADAARVAGAGFA